MDIVRNRREEKEDEREVEAGFLRRV